MTPAKRPCHLVPITGAAAVPIYSQGRVWQNRYMKRPFFATVWREGDWFVSQCLDVDIASQGSTEEEFRSCLYAPEMHDPDLIIRTSGEQRLSNYLLWQSAYSELIFRQELWPEFTREAFEESLAEFSRRRRRFGGRSA